MDGIQRHVGSRSVSLRELFPDARFISSAEIHARACACDGLACQPGDVLFVGVDELPADEAAARGLAGGAAAIVTEQLLPVPVPQCIVRDVRSAYAELVSELAGNPSSQLLSIGVIGVDGKTTTTLMIAAALRHLGLRVAYNSDLGSSDGIVQTTSRFSKNHAAALSAWYAEAIDSGCQVAVTELNASLTGDHQLDGTTFDILVVCGDADRAMLASAQGFSNCHAAALRLRPEGTIVAHENNDVARQVAQSVGRTLFTFGSTADADLQGRIMQQHAGELTFLITHGDTTATVRSPLSSDWMFSHHLAASATASLLDVPMHAVAASAASLTSVPGRMQRVASFTGPQVVLDHADTPERIMATCNSLRKQLPPRGRIWCVTACNRDHSAEHAANVANIAERCSDRLILTSDSRGSGDFLPLVHNSMDGIVDPARPQLIANRELAIRWAIENAGPNDVVVVLGGWADQSPRDQRGAIEADAAIAQTALESVECQYDPRPVILPHPALAKMA